MNNHNLIASKARTTSKYSKTCLALWGATRCRVARALKARDYTHEDIAAVTGYSFQRIGQSHKHNQLTRA